MKPTPTRSLAPGARAYAAALRRAEAPADTNARRLSAPGVGGGASMGEVLSGAASPGPGAGRATEPPPPGVRPAPGRPNPRAGRVSPGVLHRLLQLVEGFVQGLQGLGPMAAELVQALVQRPARLDHLLGAPLDRRVFV